jgi:hypothetical protein
MKYLFIICCIYCLVSCSGRSDRPVSEQIEPTIDSFNSIKEDAIPAENTSRIKDSLRAAENTEKLLGYWFMPHAATINIQFYRDQRFVFNDYNKAIGKEEKLTGKFSLQGKTLTLLYDDRPKQKFQFTKGEPGDNNYYIKNQNYYFVGPGVPPGSNKEIRDTTSSPPVTDTTQQQE